MRTREQEARKAYGEAVAQAKKVRDEAMTQTWKAFQKAEAQAEKARDEALARARKEAEGQ